MMNDYKSWMSDNANSIKGIKLKNLILPGTHDSGTSSITSASQFSPDAPPILKFIGEIPDGKNVVAEFAKSQPFNITKQLEGGCRYFDIRVAWVEDDFYLCHSLVSMKVSVLLDSVSSFTKLYPKELIILDFNHFYAMNDSPKNVQLIKMISDKLNNVLISNKVSVNDELQDIWNSKKSVIVFYGKEKYIKKNNNFWERTNNIFSPWTKKYTVVAVKEAIITYLPYTKDTFFVSQCILNPPESGIVEEITYYGEYILKGGLQGAASNINSYVCGWLKEWKSKGINIVIIDWFDDKTELTKTCIQLNIEKKLPLV